MYSLAVSGNITPPCICIQTHTHKSITTNKTLDNIVIMTSSSAVAERPREPGEFKGVDHFETKF